MFIPGKPGPGWAVLSGATKQGRPREVAQGPSDPGALSFGYFSLCEQRKATRRRRNPQISINDKPLATSKAGRSYTDDDPKIKWWNHL